MHCTNCGHKIEENADICLGCGKFIKKDIVIAKTNSPRQNGMSIASMVIGILGFLYTSFPFVWIDTAIDELLYNYTTATERISYIIGFLYVQTILAIFAIVLSLISKKKVRNGFNQAGFILAISTFFLIFLQFLIIADNI